MNCGNNDYDSRDFVNIKHLWRKSQTDLSGFKDLLSSKFGYKPGVVDAIFEAITAGTFSSNFSINDNPQQEDLIREEETSGKEVNPEDFYIETPDRSTAGFFNKGTNDPEYKSVINDFNSRIINDLIYNSKTGVGVGDPNSPTLNSTLVNDKLLEYRLDLIRNLLHIDGMPKIEVDQNIKPENLKRVITSVLSSFENVYRKDLILNDGKGVNKTDYRNYVTLYNFDKLLNELGIVKVKDEYLHHDLITPDRYIYVGEKIKYDQRFGKEDADIDDYTSPLIKLLLNELSCVDENNIDTGIKIGDGFKVAMSAVSDWAWNTIRTTGFNPYEEISRGTNTDWNKLITAYLNDVNRRNYVIMDTIRGIRKHIFSGNMPKPLVDLFKYQALNTVRASYIEYTQGWVKDHTEIQQSIPTERLIDNSAVVLNRRIANKINFLKNNPQVYERLLSALNVTVDSRNNIVSIPYTFNNGNSTLIQIKYDPKSEQFVLSRLDGGNPYEITDSKIKNVIEQITDIFLPDEDSYTKILESVNGKNLLSVFAPALGITLLASNPNIPVNLFKFDNKTREQADRFIKIPYQVQNDLRVAARFINQIYKYNQITVVNNLNGDKIPGYQLGSWFFRTQEIISDIRKAKSHALKSNTFVRNPNAITTTNIRQGILVNGVYKSIESLTPAEVEQVSIIQDIWNKFKTKKENKDNVNVDIQPMAYSDKKRQMTKQINLHEIVLLNGANLLNIVRNLRKFEYDKSGKINKDYQISENILVNEILEVRGRQTKYVALDLINKVSDVLGLGELNLLDATYNDIISKWNEINNNLKQYSKLDSIKALFKNTSYNVNEETDFVKSKNGGFVLNPRLKIDIELYLNPDHTNFINYINYLKTKYIRDLNKENFILSIYHDGSLRETFDAWNTSRKDWVDPFSGSINLFKLRTPEGNIIDTSINDVSRNWKDGSIKVELNPILNLAFYLNLYLGQQSKTLHFGESWGYKGIDYSDNYDWEEDESVRFIAQTKRAMLGGGTVKLFNTNLAFGIPKSWRMAAVNDIKMLVNDLTGNQSNEKVADGAIYASPEEAIMENISLEDSSVGEGFKKTLYGWLDELGQLNEIKTAEFTMSNINRRQNPKSREYNMEKMYYLTHKDQLPKHINLTKYYNPEGNIFNSSHQDELNRKVTHDKYIYFYDNNKGKYYRINRLIQTENGVKRILQEFKRFNNESVGEEFEDVEIPINSIYDIDQVFGGAWNMKWDPSQKVLTFDNSNNYICANILCEENLKNQIIHYIINPSAMKVNMKNINPSTVFSGRINPNESLWEFAFNPKYSGVVMDGGHSVEGGHVTEMTQMIQHIIQDGYLIDIVENIYDAIADVTREGRAKYIEGDKHTVLGTIAESLVKSLQTGSGNISTIIDSFIKLAAEDFNRFGIEMKLPFSHPQIKGKVASIIISNLTKDSLRRTYPGLGTIQAPSFGFMQYFNITDKNGKLYHRNYIGYCNDIRSLLRNGETLDDAFDDKNSFIKNGLNFVTPDYVNNWLGRTIEEINPKQIDFEDTILYFDSNTNAYVVEKINDGAKYDYWRNIQTTYPTLYRWNSQGRDLIQSVTRYNVGNYQYNLWDFDQARVSFYLQEFINKIKKPNNVILGQTWKEDFIKRYYSNISIKDIGALRAAYTDANKKARQAYLEYSEAIKAGKSYNTVHEAFISQEGRKYLRDLWALENEDRFNYIYSIINIPAGLEAIQHYLKIENPEIVNEIYNRFPTLAEQDITYSLDKPNVNFAQIMLGRMFATKFGLKSGDDVSDILRQGVKFFSRRLMSEMRTPAAANFGNLYDIQLHTLNNDNFFVLIGNTQENQNRWKNLSTVNDALKIVDGILYYNGDKVCNADGIEIATYQDENGDSYNMIYVKDNQVLQKLKSSDIFDFIRYKYTKNNAGYLLKDQYHYNIYSNNDKNLIKKPIIFRGNTLVEKDTDIDNYEFDDDTIELLNKYANEKSQKRLNKFAIDKFNAFKKSLYMIGARIPSQSMQSFSGVEVINFTDSYENEVYLPRTLTWIAGSDYDIDKFYIMAWSILNNGTLPFYKKVSGFNIDELNTLPIPNNVQFEYNVVLPGEEIDSSSISITEEEALNYNNGDIEPLRKILTSNTDKITFIINGVRNPDGTTTINGGDVTLQALSDLWNDANDYNAASKDKIHRMKSQSEHIFKNKVIHYLQEALKDVSVQMNLLTALNMDAANEVIEQNQAAANDDRTMTADNPMSIMRQQYNNMVGRAGIGAVAVSQKAFSTVSYAINYQLKEFNNRLLASTSEEEDTQILTELKSYLDSISFNGKLQNKDLRTLANINFRPLIFTLQAKFGNSDYVNTLQINSNRTNAYDLYSNIMSYATDNAKELKLDKLNAVGNFIDYYCYLFATGENFTDAGLFMTSPVMSLVRKYLKTNVFEIGSNRIRMYHVIDFIIDNNDLPIINSNLFKSTLTSRQFLNEIENSKFVDQFINIIQDTFKFRVGNILATNDQIFKILNRIEGVTFTAFDNGETYFSGDKSDFSYQLAPILRQMFRSIPEFKNTYLSWLTSRINSAKKWVGNINIDDIDADNWDIDSWEVGDNIEDINAENNIKYRGYKWNPELTTKEELISLYRYVTEYLIPKNELLNQALTQQSLNGNTENLYDQFATLKSIANGAEELSLLGRVLSINQGLKGNDFDEFNFVQGIESSINRIYLNNIDSFKLNGINPDNIERFNFRKFIEDSEYRNKQIKQYDLIKNTLNVLDVIASSPHFFEMLQTTIIMENNINQASTALRLSRNIARTLFNKLWFDGKGNNIVDKVHPASKYRITDKEFKAISQAVNDIIIYHWLVNTNRNNTLSFTVPEGIKLYDANGFLVNNISEFSLGSATGIANFKRLMDHYIIPTLKTSDEFKNEPFVRMLTLDSIIDPKTKRRKRYYKLALNSRVTEESAAYKLYDEARESFSKIATKSTPKEFRIGNWSIMDLFFLYNLITSKEDFGNTNFNQIFEDLLDRGIKTNLMNTYNQFLTDLDYGKITLSEGETTTSGDSINYNINDILWRVVNTDNAYKFNYAEIDGINNVLKVPTMRYQDGKSVKRNTITITGINGKRDASDFTLDLPSLISKDSVLKIPKWDGYEPAINYLHSVPFNGSDVIYELTRYLQQLFSNNIPIRVITDRDLKSFERDNSLMFSDSITEEQKNKIKNSNGFIHNGVIYLNADKYELTTTVHELSHLILANMKFGPNKAMYYKLLSAIWDKDIEMKYKTLYGKITPDVKEEALADWIAQSFARKFEVEWGENGKNIFNYEIKDYVQNTLNSLLKANFSNADLGSLGETSLKNLFQVFTSGLFDFGSSKYNRMKIILSQELATIKNKYVEWKCD